MAGVEAILGKANVSHVGLDRFDDKFALYSTLGKLANIITDISELEKGNEGTLKQFSCGDPMNMDRKYKDAIEAEPTARVIISANNRPHFSDKTDGLWRRMLLIPFLRQVPKEQRTRDMDSVRYWQNSGELPGMLIWALRGLQRLYTQGDFTHSQVSENATDDFRVESNPTRGFMLECLQADYTTTTVSAAIFDLYKEWCKTNGYKSYSNKKFTDQVLKQFPGAKTVLTRDTGGKRARGIEGVKISDIGVGF